MRVPFLAVTSAVALAVPFLVGTVASFFNLVDNSDDDVETTHRQVAFLHFDDVDPSVSRCFEPDLDTDTLPVIFLPITNLAAFVLRSAKPFTELDDTACPSN